MTSFKVDVPSDPRWLHVARSVTVAAAGRLEDMGALANLGLVLDEATLAVATTAGVTTVSVAATGAGTSIELAIVGSGDAIDHEDDGIDLLTVALGTLAPDHSIVRSPHEYRISMAFGDRSPRA